MVEARASLAAAYVAFVPRVSEFRSGPVKLPLTGPPHRIAIVFRVKSGRAPMPMESKSPSALSRGLSWGVSWGRRLLVGASLAALAACAGGGVVCRRTDQVTPATSSTMAIGTVARATKAPNRMARPPSCENACSASRISSTR